MSHGEDEGTAGDSAPGDTADLVSEPSLVVDFFGQGLSGRPMNFFPDTSDNVGVKPADAQMDGPGENGGEEEAHDGRDGEEVSASGIGGGNADVKEESVMAETLVNGLHHVESGGGVVVGPTEEVDPPKIVTAEQHAGESAHPPLDHGPEKIGSPQKRLDNGGENQRLGGAVHVEHHRRPPLSGSHGGGMPVQRPSEGPEGQPSRTGSGSGSGTGIGDVLYSMGSEDEDGRSRQRILAFAAKRYSNAVERNPDDHDALYNWALVLQESADNTGPETGNSGKDALLEEACKKYEGATELCPTLHEAFYNWAIAISDRAKIRGRTKEAEDLWKQACERYDKSVQLNWNSPQALNNWGLALQELGAIVPLKEKRAIVKKAIRKFRSAIRLRFDFHRAVYNLGTVLYGLAEDTLRAGRKLTAKEPTPADLYSQSAIYIAAAHALKPDYPVYRSALRLVRSMLPLPFVKAGYLTIPPVGDSLAPHSDWQRLWFVLDHEALHEKEKLDRKSYSTTTRRTSGLGESSNASTSLRPSVLRIEMEDIVLMTPCADLSLPPGGGFRIDTLTGHQFLIADTWEAMDGWVDAIRLVYTIFARGKRDSLAGVLVG